MAQVTVSVNGKPVEEFIKQEKESEIRDFYLSEMRGFRRTCHRPTVSSAPIRNTSKVVASGNNSIKFA